MPWTSGPKFCIQLVKHQGHHLAKFQPENQMISMFQGLKRPQKAQKIAKKCFLSQIGQTMCLAIIRFCICGLDLKMYLQEKFH